MLSIDHAWRRGRRLLLHAALAAFIWSAIPALSPAVATLPDAIDAPSTAATDPQVTDLDWVDPARNRPVPVRLYWPAQAAAHAPVPLVVFSHGIGSSRTGYSYLGKYFASHGVACLHLQHVGSDSQIWLGNPFGVLSRLWHATGETEAIAR